MPRTKQYQFIDHQSEVAIKRSHEPFLLTSAVMWLIMSKKANLDLS